MTVEVVPYNPLWPVQFTELRHRIWTEVKDLAKSIEHVGSTSVPGLAAKPILDIDIVISNRDDLPTVITRLTAMGYRHRGDLGIQDREAFSATEPPHRHNLYVCPSDSVALRNHLCLRESLRADSALRDEYAKLKYHLAARFPDSIDGYIEGKTAFILKILKSHGFDSDKLADIERVNRISV